MKTLLFFLLLLLSYISNAQSWQWGRRGGGSSNGLNITPIENVVDMDTDPNGNVYILARTESSGNPTIGATVLKKFGSKDIVVASFTCNGSLRWTKVIGSSDNDLPVALRSDTLGHIFVAGSFGYPDIHFDSDTSFNSPNGKTLFLAQYDTSGNLKWFSQPASDTASLTTNYTAFETYDMIPGTSGGATMLCFLSPGLLAGGGNHVVTTPGVYFLNYNAAGAITSVVPVQMSVSENSTSTGPAAIFYNINMLKIKSGKVIVSGTLLLNPPSYISNFSMGGQLINYPMFMGCFNSSGQFLWKSVGTALSGGFSYRGTINKTGEIDYACGGRHNSTFGNFTFINSLHSPSTASIGIPSFIIVDTLGNVKKGKCSAITGPNGNLAISISDKIYCSGSYNQIRWDSSWFTRPPNGGSDIYMVSFDTATLAVVSADSLKSSTGYNENISAMVSDKNGNLYVGGNFEGDLTVNNTTLNSAGGYSDFFIAKYGAANCGSVMPLQLLSFAAHNTGNSNLLQWTTAQEINVDRFEIERAASLTPQRGELEFAAVGLVPTKALNGNNTTTLSYHYTDEPPAGGRGNLFYRLKMIDKDGKFTYSPIRMVENNEGAGIIITPNPAPNGAITVTFSGRARGNKSIVVTDMFGRIVLQQANVNNQSITLQIKGAPGIYMITVTDSATGKRETSKVVVQ